MDGTPEQTGAAGQPGGGDGAEGPQSPGPQVPARPLSGVQTAEERAARAPARQCVGCGYNVLGLAQTGMCPECGRPVPETIARPLLRDDRLMCRGVCGGLTGVWWGLLGLVVLGAGTFFLGFLVRGVGVSSEVMAKTVMAGMVASAAVTLGAWAIGAAWLWRASVVARLSLIFEAVMLGTGLPLLAMALGVMDGNSGVRDGVSSMPLIGTLLTGMSVGVFGLVACMGRTLCVVAGRTDRFVLMGQTKRYALLSTLWHAVVLVPSLVLSVSIAMELIERVLDGVGVFVLYAWGLAWFGHLGWVVYTLVALRRVVNAVKMERRAAVS